MPFVEASKIEDINDKRDREKLRKLLAQRDVLNYSFSYNLLVQELIEAGVDRDEVDNLLGRCVIARSDDELKPVKEDLNTDIQTIYAKYEIKSLQQADPFGVERMYLAFESSSSSFSKERAVEMAPKFKIDTKQLVKLMDAATNRKSYISFQCRSVKEKESKEAGK